MGVEPDKKIVVVKKHHLCLREAVAAALLRVGKGRSSLLEFELLSDGTLGARDGHILEVRCPVSSPEEEPRVGNVSYSVDGGYVVVSCEAETVETAVECLVRVDRAIAEADPATGAFVSWDGSPLDSSRLLSMRDLAFSAGGPEEGVLTERVAASIKALLVDSVSSGRFASGPALVSILGPTGCGKTAFARALSREALEVGMTVVWLGPESICVAERVSSAFAMADALSPSLVVLDSVDLAGASSPGIVFLSSGVLDSGMPDVGVLTTSVVGNALVTSKACPIVGVTLPDAAARMKIAVSVFGKRFPKEAAEAVAEKSFGYTGRQICRKCEVVASFVEGRMVTLEEVVAPFEDNFQGIFLARENASVDGAIRPIPLLEGIAPGTVKMILALAAGAPEDATNDYVVGASLFQEEKGTRAWRRERMKTRRRLVSLRRAIQSMSGAGVEHQKISAALKLLRVPEVTIGELTSVLAD